MCNKKPSSDSPHKQPPRTPPTTTVDQPSQPPPPTLSLEPVDPEIIQAVAQAVAPLNMGEHEKALNFIKDSISSHPLSGQLHYTEGMIHWCLANNAAGEDAAKVKHLEDGVRATQLAVELLPKSLHCARLLFDLLYDLAFFNKNWEKVEEAFNRGLVIDDPIDFGIRDLFGDDLYKQSRLDDDMKWVDDDLEFDADINNLVMATDEMKKQQIRRNLKDNNEDILKYKGFWNITLSDEKKRGFRKVNIGDLMNHLMPLMDRLEVDLLPECIGFAMKHKTWKFWECFVCVKKFVDYELYLNHVWEVHSMRCGSYWTADIELLKESVDMILNGVWKPVDTDEALKGIGECKSSSLEDLKWAYCDDIERWEILERIRSIYFLFIKNKCLAPILVDWTIKYTEDQFESVYPLSVHMKLGVKALKVVCLLGASQLAEVLEFLKEVAQTCGLSENVDEPSDQIGHVFDITERVLFSRDFTCLLLDARVLRGELNVTNYFDVVAAGDDSAVSFSDNDDDVIPDSDDIVSWLYMGSNCEEVLDSWISLREFRRRQAKKSHRVLFQKVCAIYEEIANQGKLNAISEVEHMFSQETENRGRNPEYEQQLYMELLKNSQNKLEESNHHLARSEIDFISQVLKEAQEVLSRQECCAKLTDNCIQKASRRLKMQLLKGKCLHDVVVCRILDMFNQHGQELTNISVCDYRSIVVPMLQSFLQSHLKDLYEEVNQKAKAAEEALLAEMAGEEAEKKINKDSDNVMQKQNKKKKKRRKKKKKNKTPKKAQESEATNVSKHFEDSVDEGVSDIPLEPNNEEHEKRFLFDIEKAICLSLDCFEKRYGSLLPTDANDSKKSQSDVQLYVIVQSQWYLRQIRDEFMRRSKKRHTHDGGNPCFHCAYSDTFAAIRVASRDKPEEVSLLLSSRTLWPVRDFFEEWLKMENPANKVIDISPSACQLKQQLVEVVRRIVAELENRTI